MGGSVHHIEGSPHYAEIIFKADDRLAPGVSHANIRVIPRFDPGDQDMLEAGSCDLDYFGEAAGVTALRARAEFPNEDIASRRRRIVESVTELVVELNNIANGTGKWGPSVEQ